MGLFSRFLRRSPVEQAAPLPDAAADAGLPDFAALIAADADSWLEAISAPGRRPVLVATSTGGHHAVAVVEGMLCAALTLRGAEPQVLLCDGSLPACQECDIFRYPDVGGFLDRGPQEDRCGACFSEAAAMYERLGVPVRRYSEFLTAADTDDSSRIADSLSADALRTLVVEDVSIGEHAYAGALRFFARGDIHGEPHGEAVLRRYVQAALLTARAAERAAEAVRPEVAVFHHGIYVPQGLIGDVMRREGVRVVNWAVAYRKQCFIFSHGDTYHRTMMDEPTGTWENMLWGPRQEAEIHDYLQARWHGGSDWILVQQGAETDAARIAAELDVDFAVPTIALLTNVVWDAQLFYESNAYPEMLDWIADTIRYFERRTDLQLVIRIHPAEVTGTLVSRQRVVDAIDVAFPQLPTNVRIIGPDRKLSTYALAEQCDAVLIYGTKTGVEAAAMGIPVIVAGEAWIRGKEITLDASSASEYLRILDRLPFGERLDSERLERARRYAYHFFMRKMVPIDFMEPTGAWPPFAIAVERIGDLGPGHSRGLDIICDGILTGTPFIYPAECEMSVPGAEHEEESWA